MTDDLISRQAAIEELSAQDVYTEQDVRTAYVDGYSDGIHRGYEDAVRNYKNLALKRCEKGKSDDLISRQAAIEDIRALFEWHDIVTVERLIEHMKQLPSAQPRRNAARWIDMEHHLLCSNCGATHYGADRNFCPNCGADMRGDNNE